MLHVPAQSLSYVVDLSFLRALRCRQWWSTPKAEIPLFHRSEADSSLIHLLTSAMDQQGSGDIRSRLEHCTLEELLTNDKVISLSLLGELCRLTARGRLRSVNGVSQGCPRDRTTTLLKL
jgi:hypothetical protein